MFCNLPLYPGWINTSSENNISPTICFWLMSCPPIYKSRSSICTNSPSLQKQERGYQIIFAKKKYVYSKMICTRIVLLTTLSVYICSTL